MNLFLVQSAKTQEINGIRQTESNPIIKAQYSKIDILYEVGNLSSWSVIKTVCWWLIGFSWRFSPHGHRMYAVCYQCPLHTSPHLCVARNGFELQLGCSFSVIYYIYKMKIAALISVWTICRPCVFTSGNLDVGSWSVRNEAFSFCSLSLCCCHQKMWL